ncbi:MAG: GNAT family N-acetyltransferase [Lacisediminihabitans sp.]
MADTSGLSVREAHASDAESIAQVQVRAWRETYSGVLADQYFSAAALLRRTQFWSRYLSLEPKPGRVVIAESGGEAVGFANSGAAHGPDAEHGFPPVRPLHLFSIYLLATAQRSGLGQSMLDAVLGDAPAQLWVLRGNDRAIAFYARNGFVADGVQYVDDSDPTLVELRMIR